jgi:tetratricopeptide (TPR) repeat protein
MQKTNKLPVIAALGVLVIGGAAAYRQRVLTLRPRLPLTAPAPPQAIAPAALPAALQAQEASLRAAVAAHPKALGPRWNLVAFYGNAGQTDKAAEQVDAIDRLNPSDAANRMALANTRVLLHQYGRAEEDYRRVIARQPQSATAWQGLAATLFRQHHYFEAQQAAQKAVNLAPANAGGHLLLASSALEYALQFPNSGSRSSDLALAQSEYKKVLKVLPNNAYVYYALGRTSFGLEDANGATKDFSRSLQINPQQDIYWDAAQAYIKKNDRATAQKLAEEGLRRYPNDASLHNLRGQLLQTGTAPDADAQALAEFQKAVQFQPDSASFQSDLGTAYVRTGNLAGAQAAFESAVRLDPSRSFPYQQLAGIYTRQGDPARASEAARLSKAMIFNSQQLEQVQSLLMVHPDSVPLHLILADRYRDLHLPGPSRDEYLLVQRLDPGNARARQGLAALAADRTKAVSPPPQPARSGPPSPSGLPSAGHPASPR